MVVACDFDLVDLLFADGARHIRNADNVFCDDDADLTSGDVCRQQCALHRLCSHHHHLCLQSKVSGVKPALNNQLLEERDTGDESKMPGL